MLEKIIKDTIREPGPMRLEDYMATCLYHPDHGYYRTRDPLGSAGDFTTAPEISQLFGEMVAAWLILQWQAMGSPAKAVLVEFGPGRGTLMADILRTVKTSAPQCHASLQVHLVEISEALKARQKETLKSSGKEIHWHEDISGLPELPLLMVANEFFDALPIRQFRKHGDGWQEKAVGLEGEKLVWRWTPVILSEVKDLPQHEILRCAQNDIIEMSPASLETMKGIARRISAQGGAMLVIDYGYMESHGDTFQALEKHAHADPLAHPGQADLTAHVDFAALAAAAREGSAKTYGTVTQGEFLQRMGIQLRATVLGKEASAAQREKLVQDVTRLTAPEAMGTLFKCMAVLHPALPQPYGF